MQLDACTVHELGPRYGEVRLWGARAQPLANCALCNDPSSKASLPLPGPAAYAGAVGYGAASLLGGWLLHSQGVPG